MKKDNIDFDAISELPDELKKQAIKKLAKRANERLRSLEKHKYIQSAYRIAEKATGKKNKPRFKENFKNATAHEIEYNLRTLQSFLTAESSTLSGMNRIHERSIDTINSRLDVPISDRETFKSFLSSKQFKTLKKMVDSDELIEDFSSASDEGFSLDEIMSQYQEFLDSNITFDELEELRNNDT